MIGLYKLELYFVLLAYSCLFHKIGDYRVVFWWWFDCVRAKEKPVADLGSEVERKEVQ